MSALAELVKAARRLLPEVRFAALNTRARLYGTQEQGSELALALDPHEVEDLLALADRVAPEQLEEIRGLVTIAKPEG